MSQMNDGNAGNADLAALRELRLSQMTPAQRDDAKELWLRDQIEWVGEASRDHMKFLLRRLDEARRTQADNLTSLESLRAMLCGVGIVGAIDGHEVIRRDSVIELVDRIRHSAVRSDETMTLHEIWVAAGGNPGIRPSRADVVQALKDLDKVCDEADDADRANSARSKALALIEVVSATPEKLRELVEQHIKASNPSGTTFSPAYDAMHDAVDAASTQLHQVEKMFRDDEDFMEAVRQCDSALELVAQERSQALAASKATTAEGSQPAAKMRMG